MGRAATATVTRRSGSGKPKAASSTSKRQSAGSRKRPGGVKGRTTRARSPSRGRKDRTTGAIRSYGAAMAYLGSRINHERRPPTSRQQGARGLARAKRLLAALCNPQRGFRSVHIAGSKGKGSTAEMLSEMLRNNGLKVGLYTSPHLLDVRERIRVNGQMISKSDMTKVIAKVAAAVVENGDRDAVTYFEILTAAAFEHFKDQQVDIAIVETGLGGRYDATNVLVPEVCGLTSISYDHMQQLGSTLEQIAGEKAGIFKQDVPIVSAPQPDAVKATLRKAAAESKSPILFAGDEITFSYRFESSRVTGPQARIGIATPHSRFDHLVVPLVGQHQAINCGVAVAMLDQLKHRGLPLDDEASIAGLAKVRLEGRMEMLCEDPRVIADGAHNAASIEALMRAIGQNVPYDSMVVIFGCCADKDIAGMLKLIRLGADKIIFIAIKSPRSADPADLVGMFSENSGRMAQVASSLPEAIETAAKATTREDLICITGSFYLVSEAKRLFANHPLRPRETAGVPV